MVGSASTANDKCAELDKIEGYDVYLPTKQYNYIPSRQLQVTTLYDVVLLFR